MAKENRLRKCLVTGDTCSADTLIRFVCAPNGEIVPDVAAKLPGRGCWVKADREVLQQAIGRKMLQRFGKKVMDSNEKNAKIVVKKDLLDQIEDLLLRRCLNHLGLANRAGKVVTGFEKVRRILKAGKTGILMIANDAADNSRSKISQGLDNLQIIDMFARDDLSSALGQENAVHLALLPDGVTKSLMREIFRYEHCRKKVLN